MSREEQARITQLEAQFKGLEGERWFEGVVRQLERRFPNRSEWAEDAVATAVERAVKRERVFPTVEELKNWMFAVAFNEMRRRAVREARRPLPPWEVERGDAPSAEDEAVEAISADELYDDLRDRIRRWPSARRRTVALFVLDAERLGEPISGQDIVDHVADVLGEEISIKAAWRLKRIVLGRLMDEVTGREVTENQEVDEE